MGSELAATDHVLNAPTRFRRLLRLAFGPWPIRPAVLAVFIFGAASFNRTLSAINSIESTSFEFIWFQQFPETVALTLVGIAPLLIIQFLRSSMLNKPLSLLWYLGSIGVSSLVASAGILYAVSEEQSSIVSPGYIVTFGFRLFVIQLLLFAVFGYGELRLKRQVAQANAAMEQVLTQEELMIKTDEASRRSVADFLHDRVQSMLVTTTMQLRSISDRVDPQSKAELLSVAEHLDELRATEVREVNTRLSPNIGTVGLQASLEQLLMSLGPTLAFSVEISEGLRRWSMPGSGGDIGPLAVFRVVEQAASNAVIHGRATQVDVVVDREGSDVLVKVIDNGRGLLETAVKPGSGTAVIDSWMRIMRGSASVDSPSTGGAVTTVRFPVSAPSPVDDVN